MTHIAKPTKTARFETTKHPGLVCCIEEPRGTDCLEPVHYEAHLHQDNGDGTGGTRTMGACQHHTPALIRWIEALKSST